MSVFTIFLGRSRTFVVALSAAACTAAIAFVAGIPSAAVAAACTFASVSPAAVSGTLFVARIAIIAVVKSVPS